MHCSEVQEGHFRRATWQHDRCRFHHENISRRLQES